MTLCDSPGVLIGGRHIVLAALEKYKKGKANFGDYMIVSEGDLIKLKKLKPLIKY